MSGKVQTHHCSRIWLRPRDHGAPFRLWRGDAEAEEAQPRRVSDDARHIQRDPQ